MVKCAFPFVFKPQTQKTMPSPQHHSSVALASKSDREGQRGMEERPTVRLPRRCCVLCVAFYPNDESMVVDVHVSGFGICESIM